ncbi:MAG: hypothetical protein AAB453_01815, partial [Patescibacteria group bacterium]
TTKVDTMAGNLDTVTGNLDKLTTKVDTMAGNLDTVTGNLNTLTTKVDTLAGNLNTLTTKVDTLAGNLDTLTGNVDALAIMLKKQFEGIDSRFEGIEGILKIHSIRFDNLESDVGEIKIAGNSLVHVYSRQSKEIKSLGFRVKHLEKIEGILN